MVVVVDQDVCCFFILSVVQLICTMPGPARLIYLPVVGTFITSPMIVNLCSMFSGA